MEQLPSPQSQSLSGADNLSTQPSAVSTMTTSSHRSRLRRPFDSINANTLSSLSACSGKGSVDTNPVKKEKKKGLLSRKGILSSILPPKNKKERPVPSNPSAVESPSKKLRVEDGADPTQPNATTAVLPKAHVAGLKSEDDPATFDTTVFRQHSNEDADLSSFWDDEMEELLELKIANPVLDESRDDEEASGRETESNEIRTGPENEGQDVVAEKTVVESLTNEMDDHVSGDPLSWSDRLPENETDGIKIPFNS